MGLDRCVCARGLLCVGSLRLGWVDAGVLGDRVLQMGWAILSLSARLSYLVARGCQRLPVASSGPSSGAVRKDSTCSTTGSASRASTSSPGYELDGWADGPVDVRRMGRLAWWWVDPPASTALLISTPSTVLLTHIHMRIDRSSRSSNAPVGPAAIVLAWWLIRQRVVAIRAWGGSVCKGARRKG